ncbi:PqqD family protein [Alkalibaculum bacchi]|uniref:PqqD family protein n=1 Tax=Alkalibaculum bacchi TaxID=645887 RepID=UPI0026E960E1|nr:PqqD family protein [Alkalibaculum bacchi]
MKYIKNKDIVGNCENGGYVLLNMINGNFYGLYDLAEEIWSILDSESQFEEIVKRLSNKYIDISKSDILNDVETFMQELLHEELVFIDD